MAGRKRNVGRNDRIVRAALTPIAVIAAFYLYTVSGGPLAVALVGALGVLAFVLGTGAITGTCGVYAALGLDTCSCEDEYVGGDTWG